MRTNNPQNTSNSYLHLYEDTIYFSEILSFPKYAHFREGKKGVLIMSRDSIYYFVNELFTSEYRKKIGEETSLALRFNFVAYKSHKSHTIKRSVWWS